MANPSLIEQFKRSLQGYWPRGFIWNFEVNKNLKKLNDSFAVEFCRIQERFNQLLVETDPRKTTELLTDWEESLALPDECSDLAATIPERRNQVVQKLTNVGSGVSFVDFENLAGNLGFDVEVYDFVPFRAGSARAGDSITNQQWRFYFGVTAPAELSTTFKAGQAVAGDKLVTQGNKTLECTFAKQKPAHTNVIFFFTG